MSEPCRRVEEAKRPRTEAGQALITRTYGMRGRPQADFEALRDAILAIEAEAAAPSLTVERRLRHLCDLIVSYADLTHRVVQEGGDWRDIAHEWSGVVAQARADLAALTPSSEEPA